MTFMAKSLLGATELSAARIRKLLATAGAFSRTPPPALLQGKTVVNLFFENSTRTRTSFELAARRLGGATLSFSAAGSSVQKGETLIDTARTYAALGADCFVLRHSASGAPLTLSRAVRVPVVNAGDGFHEHPTQALLDAFTIESRLGSLKGKRVLILGDIAHSRVARSNLQVLTKLGARVTVCGPPTLLPPGLEQSSEIEFAYRPETVLPDADAVMALRLQTERQSKAQIPSLSEYARFWGLTADRARLMKPEAVILHPGPVNRGVEIAPEMADGPRSLILEQVANGVWVRMAVLATVCNPEGLEKWLAQAQSQTGGSRRG